MASLGTGRQTIVDGRFAEVQVGSGGGSDGAKPLGQHPLHLAADWTDDVAIIQALLDDVDAYLRVLRNDGTRIGIERARGVPGDPRRRLPRHRHELRVGRDGGGIG